MSYFVVLIPLLALSIFTIILFLSLRHHNKSVENNFYSPLFDKLIKFSGIFFPNIRIYTLGFFIAYGILGTIFFYIFEKNELFVMLVRFYGFSSIGLLFAALTPGLIRFYFPAFALNSLLIKMRRAIGVSSYFFALIHGVLAFFHYYNFSLVKVTQASFEFQSAFYFALVGLMIMSVLAVTSFDKVVAFLGYRWWKNVHRLIYIGTALIVLHIFIRGTHFREGVVLPALMILFLLTFIFLEIGATALQLLTNYDKKPKWLIAIFITIIMAISFLTFYLSFLKLDEIF